ncbi:MAG: hypothetical protein H7144_09145 [Burkholderiales bacterium]|nr:hypothetical protein [Phycisphaerae bacterium]
MIQTGAMLLDAYRELNSKKLFWITMILSGIVVAAFGAVGFDERGFSVFWKHFDHTFLNTRFLPKEQLYKNLFIELGVQWWLGFIALILALVSTAPMFPDFLSGGAVDLYLARPLGRTRLFLTKYFVGLLFVSFQVAVFCLASFLVIGIRGGAWVPGLFLAVPVVVLMFSYLWSICALFGTLTRSTVAALLLTLLAWALVFAIHATESTLLMFSIGSLVEAQELDRDIERFESTRATLNANPATTQPKTFEAARLWTINASLERAKTDRAKSKDNFATWHALAYAIKWPLPKTSETTALLERWLNRQFRAPRERREQEPSDEATNRNFFQNPRVRRLTAAEVGKVIRSRSAAWVIGTSLLFEGAVLALATRVFSRRDF